MKVIGGGGYWEDAIYKTPAGDDPFSVFVGDADNDGDNDIVVGDDESGYVYIYRWEGGDWAQPITRFAGGHVRSVFVADADNDGDNDIVSSFWWNDGVSILRWNGMDWDLDIRWGLYSAQGVFVADVDNDGDNDIAVADMGLDQISILPWEAPMADWGNWMNIPVGHHPVSVFVADIDDDNDNDIAVANHGDDTVTILRFPGWIPEIEVVGDGPNGVFVSDADNDGDMDVITPNYNDDTVSILRQLPGVGWTHDSRDVGTHPASVFVEDVDEDGDNDIVVSDQHSHTISILRWHGSDWIPRETLDVSQYPAGVFIADADNDGDNDVVNTNLIPGSVSIFKWKGNPNFLKSYTFVDNTAVWTDESLDVSEFADDYVQIVFQYTSFQDGGVINEGWYIDDVAIVSNTNPLNEDTDADERNDGPEAGDAWEAQKYTYEAGDEGWWLYDEPNNLWERTSDRYSPDSPSYSFHCGRDDTVEIESLLISQWFRLPMTDNLLLTFAYWWDPMPNDRARLTMEVSGGEWNSLWNYYGDDTTIPHRSWELSSEIDLSMYGGETVRFSFIHKSKTGSPSSYEGWYVDDLRIKGTTNPVAEDTDMDGIVDSEETNSLHKSRLYTFEYDSEGWWTNDWWKEIAWLGSTDRAHSGTFSMHIGHFAVLGGGDHTAVLASPMIRLPLSKTLTLSFWHKLDGGTQTQQCGNSASVHISVSGRQVAFELDSWDPLTPFDWTRETYNLEISQFGDENVAIKFYYSMVNCPWWEVYEGWYVDDVIIEATSSPLRVDTDEDGLNDYPEITSKYNGEMYNFDEVPDNWIAGGLWEIDTAHSHISYHCGRVTSATSLSDLISPPMRLPMSTYLEVSFWYWWDPIPFDSTGVYIGIVGPELPGFTSWVLVDLLSWSNPAIPTETWTKTTIDISQYAGEIVRFKFFSVTYQGDESVSEGVYIDDFKIRGTNNPVAWDTDEDIVGDHSEIVGFESGYVVNPSGFDYETSPILWDTDLDGSGDGHDPVPLDWDMDGDGIPNDSDSNMDGDSYLDSVDPDDDNDGMSDEYESKYGVEGSEIDGGGWQSPSIHNQRIALLLTGGGIASPNFPAFWNDIESFYSMLMGYDFNTDNTHVLGWDYENHRDAIDLYGPTTREMFFRFFDDIRLKITSNDFLFIVIGGHSSSVHHNVLSDDLTDIETIYYDETDYAIRGVLYQDQGKYFTRKLPVSFARMAYVIWGCWVGSVAPIMTGENRIIAMASESDKDAYCKVNPDDENDCQHFAFFTQGKQCDPWPFCQDHDGFSPGMGSKTNPKSIWDAFSKGYNAATKNYSTPWPKEIDGKSIPQLEDNNNGLTEEDGDLQDGDLSQKTFI
jgi:hypothetical protein